MAYELFLEQLPFEAETSAEIMAMHLRCTPPPPRELWPDIPVALEHLVLAMLAKDPLARPTMLMVAHALESIRSDLGTRKHSTATAASSIPTSTIPPTRRSSRHDVPNAFSPPTRRSSRHDVANGFSPTLPATASSGQRRWHVAAGALAIAASATLFLFMRDTGPANAAAPKRDPLQQVQRVTVDVPAQPDPAPAPASAVHIVHAAEPATNEPPAMTPALPASAVKSRKHPPTRKAAPVTPRRSPQLDPDGTVDPYL
jgi:serine/threonine protein kinase